MSLDTDTQTTRVAIVSRMNDTSHLMLRTLARVCRERRRLREHSQATIAERAGVSRSAINEFERVRNWPRDPDRIVRGYADDDNDAVTLWQTAASRLTSEENA